MGLEVTGSQRVELGIIGNLVVTGNQEDSFRVFFRRVSDSAVEASGSSWLLHWDLWGGAPP